MMKASFFVCSFLIPFLQKDLPLKIPSDKQKKTFMENSIKKKKVEIK